MITAKTYITWGRACRRGHQNAERYVSNQNCVQCVRDRSEGTLRPKVLSARKKAVLAGNKMFDLGIACRNGHGTLRSTATGQCPDCSKARNAAIPRDAASRQNEMESRRRRYIEDPEYRAKIKARKREWMEKSVEWRRNYHRRYSEKNPERIARNRMKYEVQTSKATPEWLTTAQWNEMRDLYVKAKGLTETTSVEHHVDHIVPLRGKNVSGLNVPWNLRILTAEDNKRKNATMPEPEELLGHTTRSIYYVPVDG